VYILIQCPAISFRFYLLNLIFIKLPEC